MFSFFRRSKSKEDDKKDKKEKSSSPFTKRNENKVGNSSKQEEPPVGKSTKPAEDAAQYTPVGNILKQGQTLNISQEQHTDQADSDRAKQEQTVETHDTNNHVDEHNNNSEMVLRKHKPGLTRQEFFLGSVSSEFSHDSKTWKDNSFNSPTDSAASVSKCNEEETIAETEVVFKTAPNTPVLTKHLAFSVTDDILNDLSDTLEKQVQDSEPAEAKEDDTTEETASYVDRTRVECPGELYDIAEESSTEDEDEDIGLSKKNMVNQEAKFQEKVGDLAAQLETKDAESKQLLYQIDELQRDVNAKTGGMDRLQAELISAHKESEVVRKRLRKLEEDIEHLKEKNSELTDELLRRDGDSSGNNYLRIMELEDRMREMTDKIKNLETQLETVTAERDKLKEEAKVIEMERDEERKIVQEALDEALSQKETIQRRFEQDFEKLRTVNTDREQQLLDDFEWKLREVEQACKKRLDEKERVTKLKIKEMEDKLKAVEADLARVEVLKQFEAEATQLRGVNSEQEKAIKAANKMSEQLHASEKTLTEEVQRLKTLLERERKNLTTVQGIHNREISEKDRKLVFKLEQQKNELNTEYEEKLKKESLRIKAETEKQHRDEKRQVLEKLREEKEEELRLAKLKWTTKQQDALKEVEILKERLTDQANKHHKELSDLQTNTDRDIFDLRRKLDKIDLTYQEEIEKLQAKHDIEITQLTEEHEKKLQQCEQNWQLQIGTTRTTLELVKEQLQREAQDKLQALSEQHRRQLEEQWEQLVQERDETVEELEQRHRQSTEKLRAELDSIYKARNSRENELLDMITQLRKELSGKSNIIGELQNNVDSLQGGIQVLNQEVLTQKQQMIRVAEETEVKLRDRQAEMESVHKKQLADVQQHYQKENEKWKTIAEQTQNKLGAASKQLEEIKQNSDSTLVKDLRRALSEKEQQVAQLSKEKHLYQLELMKQGSVPTNQRRKGKNANKGGGKHK